MRIWCCYSVAVRGAGISDFSCSDGVSFSGVTNQAKATQGATGDDIVS